MDLFESEGEKIEKATPVTNRSDCGPHGAKLDCLDIQK